MALSQQRAATLVVTKDNDDPPTYEVIPYSTGRCLHRSLSVDPWMLLQQIGDVHLEEHLGCSFIFSRDRILVLLVN